MGENRSSTHEGEFIECKATEFPKEGGGVIVLKTFGN